MSGPLTGFKVIEIAGIGPGPFAAMLLGDMGADVIRVERPEAVRPRRGPNRDVLLRNRRSVAIDLKSTDGRDALLAMVEQVDALIEGFRPGVMERLGLSPETCLARNPALVYGRMTGWGQTGPYAPAAGHDINYIALAGALFHFARADEAPVPPLNLVGDFGGGGMLLAFGVVCGLLEAARSGVGQVVDAAMVDGTALLMAMAWAHRAMGAFDPTSPGRNMLDTGAPYYDVYRCRDGRFISVGAVEPQFYAALLRATGLDGDADFAAQNDRDKWPILKERLREVFATRTRDEWCAVMEHTDICFAPVLAMDEAVDHPHNRERATFTDVDGVTQPAPAPRFSRTPGAIEAAPVHPGEHTVGVLTDFGFDAAQIDRWRAAGVVKDRG
jgi:alpha-methylacyl-CoA racemase